MEPELPVVGEGWTIFGSGWPGLGEGVDRPGRSGGWSRLRGAMTAVILSDQYVDGGSGTLSPTNPALQASEPELNEMVNLLVAREVEIRRVK
jgi:hypothetical protein